MYPAPWGDSARAEGIPQAGSRTQRPVPSGSTRVAQRGAARFRVLTPPDSPPTTPRALTSTLRAAGTLGRGTVVTIRISEQVQTTVSNLHFLEARYSADAVPSLPERLLLKWPRAHSAAPGEDGAETAFYRDIAPALPAPPIVRCLATAPPGSDRQWLILEDLRSTHTCPPWPERPSDEDVRDAVAVLAQLHCRWWDISGAGLSLGSPHTEASLVGMVHEVRSHLPAFLDYLGEDLRPADRLVLETVFTSSLKPWLRLVEPRDLTVIHGDAHTWNFLYSRSGRSRPYLIDWQTWHRDVGARDLAYLMALHWDAPTRRRLELPLLRLYHQELNRGRVTTYSFDDLLLDYRRCVVRNLTFPIIFWSRGFPRQAWRDRLDCALAAYRDLDAAALL